MNTTLRRDYKGKFRRADRSELMGDNERDILRSYADIREVRQRWAEDEAQPSHTLTRRGGPTITFKVEVEWDTQRRHRELRGGYVETDDVTITYRYTRKLKLEDRVISGSREWARAYYRELLANGYSKPSTF